MSSAAAGAEQRSTNQNRAAMNLSIGNLDPHDAEVPVVSDSYWVPDVSHMDTARRQKPWRGDPHFFTSVSVSLSATVKMFMHGTRGCPDMSQGRFNWFEVMGLLIGHFHDRELVLTDSFSLPVAASEVECSMTEASQIYMANYLEYHRRLGKAEPGCVGWYHTHPGYSCFLSGIDVTTQQGSQRMQDPWVALVIDPVETLRTGHFSMKAFRTYPEGYSPPEATQKPAGTEAGDGKVSSPIPPSGAGGTGNANYGLPPANRIKDFGMHAHRYYELPVRIVQSTRDAPLWAMLQQHFWPLSLSLSFPFAASTRTCQCSSKEMATAVAALAAAMNDGLGGGRIVTTQLLSIVPRRDPGEMPLLYQVNRHASTGAVGGRGSGGFSETKKWESAALETERQLLELTRATLRAKAESFSLMTAGQPTHSDVLQALRVVSLAAITPTVEETNTTTKGRKRLAPAHTDALSPAGSPLQMENATAAGARF